LQASLRALAQRTRPQQGAQGDLASTNLKQERQEEDDKHTTKPEARKNVSALPLPDIRLDRRHVRPGPNGAPFCTSYLGDTADLIFRNGAGTTVEGKISYPERMLTVEELVTGVKVQDLSEVIATGLRKTTAVMEEPKSAPSEEHEVAVLPDEG
jgi:hypothetical protein